MLGPKWRAPWQRVRLVSYSRALRLVGHCGSWSRAHTPVAHEVRHEYTHSECVLTSPAQFLLSWGKESKDGHGADLDCAVMAFDSPGILLNVRSFDNSLVSQ